MSVATHFRNRYEAGEFLADKLQEFAERSDVLVVGLPRGGVPVAAEVAKRLQAPLDVFVVRKLGVPGHPELAMGAIAGGGVRVLNTEVIEPLHIPAGVIEEVTAREQEELTRREQTYRDDRPAQEIKDKIVIIVDDGIATGSTMAAAIAALRQLGARHIIVAVPTAAATTVEYLRLLADEVVAVLTPYDFYGVGQWYEDFSQTGDEEVHRLLQESRSDRS
jgi:predicted phosphoribosyltransferase